MYCMCVLEQRYMNNMVSLGKKTLGSLVEMKEEHPPPLSDIFMKSVEEVRPPECSISLAIPTLVACCASLYNQKLLIHV